MNRFSITAIASMLAGCALLANPDGGSIAAGDASFSGGAGHLTVTQHSDRAVINWQDFSIGASEVTRFVQPSATSAVLNRVIGGASSSLLGQLEANGQVYLINPNGVLIGQGARIDAGGFLASTLEVSDQSFLGGGDLLFTGNSTAAVQNLGAINVTGGDVFLIARKVENAGTLSAAGGTAGLAAGSEVLLTTGGQERVFVRAASAPGEIVNAGQVAAVTAELKAAGGNSAALAINHSGLIRATGTAVRDGQVWLVANQGDVVSIGTIAATSGERGGQVAVLGDRVGLAGTSTIDVSGAQGGGTARVGGDYQGANAAVKNARETYVAPGATIKADATQQGQGGNVIVWSDETTNYFGEISARGGQRGGDGGLTEVSGRQNLAFSGRVDLTAPAGRGGTLLLDPLNIVLDSSTQSPPPNSGNGTPDVAFGTAPASGTYTIEVGDVVGFGELYLQATNDITLNSNLTMNYGNSVVFQARNDININARLQTTNGGNITLNADHDANGTGTLRLGSSGSLSASSNGGLNGIITITAADVDFNATSSISGSGQTTITPTANRTIGLGTATGGMSLSSAELGALRGNVKLTTGATGNAITVAGASASNPTTLQLSATAGSVLFNGSASSLRNLTIDAATGVSFLQNLNLGTNSLTVTTPGTNTISFGPGATITTGSATLTANDFPFGNGASINTGATSGSITLTLNNNRTFGVGLGTGDYLIDDARVANNLVTKTLTLNSSAAGAAINVDNANYAARNFTLNATASTGDIAFVNHSSSFDALNVNAPRNVTVNQSITATGATKFYADYDRNASGNLTFADGVVLTGKGGVLGGYNVTLGTGTLVNFGTDALTLWSAGSISLGETTAANINADHTFLGKLTYGDLTADSTFSGTAIKVDNFNFPAKKLTLTAGSSGAANSAIEFSGHASSVASLAATATKDITFNTSLTAATGPISLSNGSNATPAKITLGSGATVKTAAPDSSITLSTGDIAMAATGSFDAGAGSIAIAATHARSIGLGSAVGNLSVTDAEFANLTAGSVTLMSSAQSTDAIVASGLDASHTQLTLNAYGVGAAVRFNGTASSAQSLSINANGAISFDKNFTATTGGIDAVSSSGLFKVGSGALLSAADQPITISASDFEISGGARIDAGTGAVGITSSSGRTLGLGDAAADMQISGAELQAITAGSLLLTSNYYSSGAGLTVSNVTAVNSANVGPVTLKANVIAFTGASTFKTLTADASTETRLGANITTTVGELSSNPTYSRNTIISDGASITLKTTDKAIRFGGALLGTTGGAAESLTLAVGTGDLAFNGPLGSVGNTDLEALTLQSANNVTFRGTINLANALDLTASGTATFFGGTSVSVGSASLTATAFALNPSSIVTTGDFSITSQTGLAFGQLSIGGRLAATAPSLTLNSILSAAGTGTAVTLTTTGTGDITMNAGSSIVAQGHDVLLAPGGTLNLARGASIVTNGGDFSATLAPGATLRGTIATGAGKLDLTASGAGSSLLFDGANLSTTTGALTINVGREDTAEGARLELINGAFFATGNGTITLNNADTASGILVDQATLTATGTGSIQFNTPKQVLVNNGATVVGNGGTIGFDTNTLRLGASGAGAITNALGTVRFNGLSHATGDSLVSESASSTLTAGKLQLTGRSRIALTDGTNNIGTFAAQVSQPLALTTASALTIGTVGATNGVATGSYNVTIKAGGNLTLAQPVAVTGAAAINLVTGGAFINQAGASALSRGTGPWRVWSVNPEADTIGGLAFAFKQVDATYGVTAPAAAGDGLFYSVAPTIGVSLTGPIGKAYDTTTDVTLVPANYVLSGVLNHDTVVLNATTAFADKNAGTGKTVKATGLTVTVTSGGAPVYGYKLASTDISADIGTITPVALTLTGVAANSRVYDATNITSLDFTHALLTGILLDDQVELDGSAAIGTFASKNVGSAKPVTVTGVTLSGDDALNYTLAQPAGLFANVTAKALTLTGLVALDRIYDGSRTAQVSTEAYGFEGVEAADDGRVTLNTAALSALFADKNVGTDKPVTVTGLALGGAEASNYTLTPPTGLTADIGAKALTIAIVGTPTKTYDGTADARLDATDFQLDGLIDGESLTVTQTAGAYDSANVVEATTVSATLADDQFAAAEGTLASNYILPTEATGAGRILAKDIVVTATGGRSIYSESPANPGFTATGLVNGETEDVLTGLANDFAITSATDAASYPLSVAGTLTNGNYSVTARHDGLWVVAPKPLTAAIVGTPTKVYDGNTSAALSPLNFVLTGLVGDESFSVTQTAGTYNSANVDEAATVTAALTGAHFAPGADTLASNYVLPTSASGDGAITPATLTYVAAPATRLYGVTTPVFDGTVTGWVADETQATATTGTLAFTSDGKNVGTYAITGSGLAAKHDNYVFEQAPTNAAALTIDPAPLTVRADDLTKIYGSANPAFTASYTGLMYGEDASVLGGELAFATPATAASGVGHYDITPSGLTASNYALTFEPGTLAITPAALIIRADDLSRAYGDPNPPFTATFEGLVNDDTSDVVSGLTLTSDATVASPAGDYTIHAANGTAANYTITHIDGTLEVKRSMLEVGGLRVPVVTTPGREPIIDSNYALVEFGGRPTFVPLLSLLEGAPRPVEDEMENALVIAPLLPPPGAFASSTADTDGAPSGSGEPGAYRETSIDHGAFNVIYREPVEAAPANEASGASSSFESFRESEHPKARVVRPVAAAVSSRANLE